MQKNTTNPGPGKRRREDIAELLARVFAHPDLPQAMWDHMSEAICEMDCDFDKYENPEVMREVIAGQKTVKGGRL